MMFPRLVIFSSNYVLSPENDFSRLILVHVSKLFLRYMILQFLYIFATFLYSFAQKYHVLEFGFRSVIY